MADNNNNNKTRWSISWISWINIYLAHKLENEWTANEWKESKDFFACDAYSIWSLIAYICTQHTHTVTSSVMAYQQLQYEP